MYNIYSIVILIVVDIPRFSVKYLHQNQIAAAPKYPAEVVAESRHTAVYHLLRRGNEYRALIKPMRDMYSKKEDMIQNSTQLDVAGKMTVNTNALCSIGEEGHRPAKCVA